MVELIIATLFDCGCGAGYIRLFVTGRGGGNKMMLSDCGRGGSYNTTLSDDGCSGS